MDQASGVLAERRSPGNGISTDRHLEFEPVARVAPMKHRGRGSQAALARPQRSLAALLR
jgi:hypothetical protein